MVSPSAPTITPKIMAVHRLHASQFAKGVLEQAVNAEFVQKAGNPHKTDLTSQSLSDVFKSSGPP